MSTTMKRNHDFEAESTGTDVPGVPDLTPEGLAAEWAADSPPPSGSTANLAASLVAAGLGVAGMVIAVGLGLGTPGEPRPGTWPFIISLIIAVLALAQLVVGRRGGVDGERFSPLSRMAAFGFVTLLAMVWLMPVIGFEIPALLLCFVWMKFLGGETWRSATLYSVLVVAAFYAIFILGLGTSIPHLF
ncbi:tripartite tricarboxylate transporter TctB family protein [Arthrobacter sp. Soil782]|uniref:tripartite tricarboxylate transporter TctB family protein n=1 Tax=Arthrobacter sp. Soil782 TaxID=1736410 RepID=UPI001F3D293A|nr:tripartite tricarboxylate transporter TctB family protein [Arthrobacter sp. Soil782]